jgi:uncharacterized protein
LDIFTGFVIGLLGSLHCIGMCGPIALALPAGKFKSMRFYFGRIYYNLGRVVTYSFFGLIFGIIGKNFAMAGLQSWVSIISGAGIIIIVLLPQRIKTSTLSKLQLYRLTDKIKNAFGSLFKSGSLTAMFCIGILNGFLPCGFVYVGLAGALASGEVTTGILYMALFGLGTLPVMFAASVAGNYVSIGIRQKLTKVIPVLAILLAVIFILRGLSLGIPYISPKSEKMHINGMMQDGEKKKPPCCE